MPLFEKARIELYLPDLPLPNYAGLLNALEREFTHAFGGCTVLHGLSGSYLSAQGQVVQDRVNLIYTDLPFSLNQQSASLSRYADRLRVATFRALNEEAILVVAYAVYHSE